MIFINHLLKISILFLLLLGTVSNANQKPTIEGAVSAYNKGDYSTAFNYFKILAEQGNSEAQFNLSRLYLEGKGVKNNSRESVKWLNRAAEQGMSEAQAVLGILYFYGFKEINQDFATSFTWLILAAEQGNSKAIKALRDLHEYSFKPSSSKPSSSKTQQHFACIDACEADVKAQSDIACKSLSSTDGSSLGGYQTSSEGKCYDSFSSAKLACSTKCMP